MCNLIVPKYRAYCYDEFYELNEYNEYNTRWVMVEILTLHIATNSLRGRYYKNRKPIVKNYQEENIQAIMRYSSRKDIKGTEVCEGDIIQEWDNLYIVKFGHGVEGDDVDCVTFLGFYLSPIDNNLYKQSLLNKSGKVRGTVIGNIYEHSHVIK